MQKKKTVTPAPKRTSSRKVGKPTVGTTSPSLSLEVITHEVGTDVLFTCNAPIVTAQDREWLSNTVNILLRTMEKKSLQSLTVTIKKSPPSKTGKK